MNKLEYYLILVAARMTGDLLTSCLRWLKAWCRKQKAIKILELNKDNIDAFFYEQDKKFMKWYEEEFGKEK